MGELKIKLPDELERAFRERAMRKYGYVKGAISEAIREMINVWIKESGGELTKEDLWDNLEGSLKHIKKSSVELQHEAGNYLAENYAKIIKKRK